MSCTRSQSVFATMMFSYSSGPESWKISAGRFQPSNISCCFRENENIDVSLHVMSLGNEWLYQEESKDILREKGVI